MSEGLISKCGMDCGRCPWSSFVRKTLKTDREYERFRERCRSVLGFAPSLKGGLQNCLGCHTPDEKIPKESRIPLRNCLIRQCVDKAGMKSCAYCSEFPCEFMEAHGTLWAREKIEKKRGKPLSEEEYLEFVEPFEGLKHLEKIRDSLSQEDIVEAPSVPPLKTEIEEFPENLPFSKKERAAFKSVHKLLGSILSSSLGLEDTDTFMQQQRLKRRMPFFLRFLWIFGCFGELKTEKEVHLVVTAEKYLANRGSQKTLSSWSYVEGTVLKVLSGFGVRCKLAALNGLKADKVKTPTGALRKGGWTMTMKLDESAGGLAALKALATYSKKLDRKYGKKAFQYFSKADMRVLCKE